MRDARVSPDAVTHNSSQVSSQVCLKVFRKLAYLRRAPNSVRFGSTYGSDESSAQTVFYYSGGQACARLPSINRVVANRAALWGNEEGPLVRAIWLLRGHRSFDNIHVYVHMHRLEVSVVT